MEGRIRLVPFERDAADRGTRTDPDEAISGAVVDSPLPGMHSFQLFREVDGEWTTAGRWLVQTGSVHAAMGWAREDGARLHGESGRERAGDRHGTPAGHGHAPPGLLAGVGSLHPGPMVSSPPTEPAVVRFEKLGGRRIGVPGERESPDAGSRTAGVSAATGCAVSGLIAIAFALVGILARSGFADFFRVEPKGAALPTILSAVFLGIAVAGFLGPRTWRGRLTTLAIAALTVGAFLAWREHGDRAVREPVVRDTARVLEILERELPRIREEGRLRHEALAEVRRAMAAAAAWDGSAEGWGPVTSGDLQGRPVLASGLTLEGKDEVRSFSWRFPLGLEAAADAADDELGRRALRRAEQIGLGRVRDEVRHRGRALLPDGFRFGPHLEILEEEPQGHPAVSLVLADTIGDPSVRRFFQNGAVTPGLTLRDADGRIPMIVIRVRHEFIHVGEYRPSGEPAYACRIRALFFRWPEEEALGTWDRRFEPPREKPGEGNKTFRAATKGLASLLGRTLGGEVTEDQVTAKVPLFQPPR